MEKLNYYDGKLFLYKKEWYLDAEPQVLVLFERLFPKTKIKNRFLYDDELSNKSELPKLEFTDRPRAISDSGLIRKDINWFKNRFRLLITNYDLKLLNKEKEEYDLSIEEDKKS